jgi:cellulose synthase (UDP-forming)
MQIVAFTLPYVFSIYLVMDYFYAGTRQPFFSEIYESVQSLFLMPAVISVLLNPWKPSFKVTPKGLTNEKNYLSPLAAPFFLVIAINITAVILAGYKWFSEPLLREVIAVTVIWSFYNLYLSIASLGAFWERKQIRKFYRIGASGTVTAHFPRIGATYTGEVRDVSLTGIGFEIRLPFLPRAQEPVILEVKDNYGRTYHFDNKIQHTVDRNGKYFCGSEFIVGQVPYADVVSYVFGDSQRWQDNWDQKSASRGTYLMLWYFIKTGFLGFISGVVPLFVHTLGQLWKLAGKLATTHIMRDKALAAASWCVYYFYLALATLVQMLDRKQARKLQRLHSSGTATIYFPRLDATLLGEVTDVSLTGIGVVAELPFLIREREHATIKTTGKDGVGYQFACVIQRTIKRDEKFLFGAEFIVDIFSYPRIVKFVYGSSLRMLEYVLMQSGGLVAHGGAATSSIMTLISGRLVLVSRILTQALAFLFLNPAYRAEITKRKSS